MLGVLALRRLMQVFGQVTYRLLVIYLSTISLDLDVLKGYIASTTTHKRVREEDNGDDACSKRVTEDDNGDENWSVSTEQINASFRPGNLSFTCDLLIYQIV